jgi:murein DD-endopeptidase MepM/ murein hydrolase activator NlpD
MSVLLRLLEISVALSPVALALLLAAPLLGKRYGAGFRAFVWLALALRLLVPFNAPLEHAVRLPFSPAFEAEAAWQAVLQTEAQPMGASEAANAAPAAASAPAGAATRNAPVDPAALAVGIWAIGAAAVLVYHLGAYAYSRKRLSRWCAKEEDAETLRVFGELKRELGVKTKVALLRSKEAASPLLIGFLRPKIYLPEQALSSEQLEFALRHELCHLKRAELWQKLALLLANAAHWFNPFMWLMSRRAAIDAELACDAKALQRLGGEKRMAYGRAVLSLMEKSRLPTPLTSNFNGGKNQMKERFLNIIDENVKKRALIPILVVLAVIVTASATVTALERPKTLDELSAEDAAKFSMNAKEFKAANVKITAADRLNSSGKYTVTYSDVDDETNTGTIVLSRAGEPDSVAGNVVISIADGEITALDSGILPKTATAGTPPEFAWPIEGEYRVVTGFDGYPGHTGIDIIADEGTPVLAAADGTVVLAKNNGWGYGRHIIIDHGNGFVTLYAHNYELLAEIGDTVEQGQEIAKIGASGNAYGVQLHFEVRQIGEFKDPEDYLPA